jgi:aspartyl-tRNA(Asn)/glutamyl-tRNA(Gln) amidotransferase subunit A
MLSIHNLSLHQAARHLRSGDFSSRELTTACLERIERLEPSLHAFITLTPELALDQANQADRRLASWRKEQRELPPLLSGIPIAIKDVLCVKDVRCTSGSRILENFIPPYHATAVERLLQAGAVLLGKTNTDEFAMGSSTENSAYGLTHNPWDPSRVPGGSSGGSAAAVAARLVLGALGSDTGGSVRQPASFCGVSGLKPTYGRVSRYGLVAFGSSLDAVGAIAQQASDVAALFSVIAGYDPRDATSADLPVPQNDLDLPPASALRGLRVGIPEEYFIAGIQREVESAVGDFLKLLEEAGAELARVSLPHTSYALPVYYLIAPAEASANLARYDGIRYGPREPADAMWQVFRGTRGRLFGPEVKRRIMLGTYALSAGYYDAYYGKAQKVRTLIKRDFEHAFERVDVIAAPVAPTTAFPIGEHAGDPLAMYLEDVFTLPANLAGIPSLAFPVGFDQHKLPIGVQLMGPHFREDTLFRISCAYQKITDWHLRTPAL